jgi:hypothetical protein
MRDSGGGDTSNDLNREDGQATERLDGTDEN